MSAPFTEHPEFMRISRIASEAVIDAARALDCENDLYIYEPQANRVVDDLTKLLLRAWKKNHS